MLAARPATSLIVRNRLSRARPSRVPRIVRAQTPYASTIYVSRMRLAVRANPTKYVILSGDVHRSAIVRTATKTVPLDSDRKDVSAPGCISEVSTCLYQLAPNGKPPVGSECENAKKLCMGGACVSDVCTNQILDGDETDIDCGGSICPGCGIGQACSQQLDCADGVCDLIGSATCEVSNTCGNGAIENGESCDDGDVTAGDGCSATCLKEGGQVCSTPNECDSRRCNAWMCTSTQPTHCTDGIKSGDESDVDCGGSCTGCTGSKACTDGDDCLSYACGGNACEPAHCGDGVQSGDEGGVDCGGSCGTACVVYDCGSQSQISLAECEVLKNYYNATDGPEWVTVTDWFSDAAPCTWTGIICTAIPGNISELHVLETNQHGVIPRGMDVLSALAHLELSAATCCGTYTELRGFIPPELGLLQSLQSLNLQYNRLTGGVAIDLSALSNLKTLQLNNNALTGGLPVALSKLSTLENLWLYANALTGPLPVEFSTLANLVDVNLRENQLSGAIPPEYGALASLERFTVYSNNLSGPIPSEFGTLNNLNTLNVRLNSLTGQLPVELSALTNLTDLYFYRNQLDGAIPPEYGALTELVNLSFRSNKFTGPIPNEISSLTKLKAFWLSNNQLSGMVPTGITNLTMLATLDICSQTGSLTADVATGTWMRTIPASNWPQSNNC